MTTKRFADEAHLASRVVADELFALGHWTAIVEALAEYELDHGQPA